MTTNKTALYNEIAGLGLMLSGTGLKHQGGAQLLMAGPSTVSEVMAGKTMTTPAARRAKMTFGPGFSSAPKQASKVETSMKPRTLKDVLLSKLAQKNRQTMSAKDLIVSKIRQAKTAAVRTQAEVTIGANDVAYVSKLASAMTKEAGAGDFLAKGGFSELGSGLVNALQTVGLVGLGGAVVGGAYDRLSDAMKRQEAYHQMFQEFPKLNELPREDVDKYWTVLTDFAPKLATNPLVAGQFIENMSLWGQKGIDHNTAGQLLQMQANANNAAGTSDLTKMMSSLGVASFNSAGGALGQSQSDYWPGPQQR